MLDCQSKQLRQAPDKPVNNTAQVPPKTRKRQPRVHKERASGAIKGKVLQSNHYNTRQQKVYKKERASQRLAHEPPQFGMFAEQSVTPLLYKPPLRTLNASKPISSGLCNRAPLKSTVAKGAKPQGISKSGRKGTNCHLQ
jgi:hypothetical protein